MDETEIFSLSESCTSDGSSNYDVSPVEQVLVPVPENDDVERLAQVTDDDSWNVNGRNGM